MENVKIRVSTHLANGCTTKHSIARELISALTFIRLASGKIVAKHLGLDRHYIYQSLQLHNLIDDGAIDF
jgi:hypothetical protein